MYAHLQQGYNQANQYGNNVGVGGASLSDVARAMTQAVCISAKSSIA